MVVQTRRLALNLATAIRDYEGLEVAVAEVTQPIIKLLPTF